MTGALNEHVFQIGLADGDGIDLAGESLHQFGDKLVTFAPLEPNPAIEHSGSDSELLSYICREFVWIGGAQEKDIAADLAAQVNRRAEGHHFAKIQNRQAVTP